MDPQIKCNFLAMLVAIVASFIFSWIWHEPLFGKCWRKMMNYPESYKMEKKKYITAIIFELIGTYFTVWVLTYSANIWRPSVWRVGFDDSWYIYGFMAGFWTWLGFYLPSLISTVAWEGKTWKWLGFIGAYYFLNLQLIAMIVTYMY